ncbi:SPFH domain-containing protein [Pendulispora brunnea]|uniref:SPFH domain-containing protein n=1 Tax=Pendulispora brunnea TaxID=2905690 RepID=A0ABZ2KHZ2_9BACT
MGVFDFIKNGVREMMIARPDNMKHLICFKHPDQNFPMYSQLTVDSDEVAVFFKDGRVVGVLPPGRHTLQTQNIPFLNNIVNKFTGGDVFISEIFFVKTTPIYNVPFGGNSGKTADPTLGVLVTPRYNGFMSVVVADPVQFVVAYAGQAGGADNERLLMWITGLFLNGVKQTLGDFAVKRKLTFIDLSAYTTEFVQSFVANSQTMTNTGLRLLEVGRFDIVFDNADQKKLDDAYAIVAGQLVAARAEVERERIAIGKAEAQAKQKQFELDQKYNQDARYVQNLAGNWQNYAAGSAIMGAGEGMREHGVGDGLAGLGAQVAIGANVGGAMAGAFTNQPQFAVGAPQQQAPTQAPQQQGGAATCPKCGARQPQGKFCQECGTSLAPQRKFCTGCSQELIPPTVKFCGNCGTSTAAPTQASGG